MIFLPLFAGFNWDEFIRFVVYDRRWVSIEMSLLDLGLQFMIGIRWWGICWVWVCSLWSGWGGGAFVGFGFLGSDQCVCWFWFYRLQLMCLLGLGLVFLLRCLCKEWTQTRRIWRWDLEGCYTNLWGVKTYEKLKVRHEAMSMRSWRRWDLKLKLWV